MSTFYKESNDESTKSLYDKTIIYLLELSILAGNYSCLVDFNFAEKYLYGRVDRNFVSIQPRIAVTPFTEIPNSSNDSGRVEVMSFVAEAFAGLSRHFIRSTQIGAIRKNDPYLSNLVAYAGYEKPEVSYQRYINSLIESMSIVKDENNFEILDFESFINFLSFYSQAVGKTFPITKTGFVRSRHASVMNNGLSIEVTDLSYLNDEQKISQFVNSPNFEYYLNACNSYGFMVDLSIPWRLVADLDSVAMQGYANRYGYPSTDRVLNLAFQPVHSTYFNNFGQQLLAIYNSISKVETKFDHCNNQIVAVRPAQYTIEKINNLYDESYFIKLYCMLRFIEEESKHSKAKQDQIITDTINLSRFKNVATALGRFERFVSQPFDYRGSLSYIVKEEQKREGT